MMKKAKEVKETRKNNQNLFKYINASKPSAFPLQSKTHTRSMMDLDPNARYQQSARQIGHHNKENHHLSLCNHTEEQEQEVKSNSLKKFLSLFGTNPVNNPILNPTGSNARLGAGRDEKQTARNSSRQVFTCNIKNMNVNVSNNSKEKDSLENKSTLVLKKDKAENNSNLVNQLKIENEELKIKLKSTIHQYASSMQLLKQKVKALQKQNLELKNQIGTVKDDKLLLQEKFALRQRSLQKTIQNLQKNINKQKCRQHDLIIESLKKVINEQLRKIIQLQKFKIQKEEIQKLQERINKNMAMNSVQNSSRQKNNLMEVKELLKMGNRDRDETIKIADDNSFNQSALTSHNDNSRFQMIEEAEQNEQFSRQRSEEDGDSILEEVDKYLVQWRSKH